MGKRISRRYFSMLANAHVSIGSDRQKYLMSLRCKPGKQWTYIYLIIRMGKYAQQRLLSFHFPCPTNFIVNPAIVR